MKKKGQKRKALIFLTAGVIFIAISVIAVIQENSKEKPERISYAEYTELLDSGQVDTVIYNSDNDYMTVILYNEQTKSLSEEEREEYEYDISQKKTVLFPDSENFREDLLEQGIIVKTDTTVYSEIADYFELLFSLALLVGMFMFMAKMSPMGSHGFARKISADEIEVTFDDVIGHEEIKGDLQLLVKQLKSGVKAKDLSHGILFEGEAGTGKTMLAKAIAHEAGVNFISVNSSNLIEMYVGLGAKRVREAFKEAREASPCVLFFDELDAVGAKRGSQRSNRENDQTINALLTELDGFDEKGEILVIAATNRADELDEALLRSGRFDRKIRVTAPRRWETRQELFDHYLNGKSDENVDTEVLAKQTVGFSGADIASICREARLIAFREDKEKISQAFLEEAIDKMVFKGNRSNDEQHEEDVKVIAYHEAGHAVMTYLLGGKISRISVLGMTSGVGGAVFQADNERYFQTKKETQNRIMTAYAGRASEEIRFGADNITQGAENDITQATKLLYAYTAKLGYDERMGLVDIPSLTGDMPFSQTEITTRLSELSNDFYDRTTELLRKNYDLVEALADRLMTEKTLSGEDAEHLLKDKEISNGKTA